MTFQDLFCVFLFNTFVFYIKKEILWHVHFKWKRMKGQCNSIEFYQSIALAHVVHGRWYGESVKSCLSEKGKDRMCAIFPANIFISGSSISAWESVLCIEKDLPKPEKLNLSWRCPIERPACMQLKPLLNSPCLFFFLCFHFKGNPSLLGSSWLAMRWPPPCETLIRSSLCAITWTWCW